jgi:hypothetical protein
LLSILSELKHWEKGDFSKAVEIGLAKVDFGPQYKMYGESKVSPFARPFSLKLGLEITLATNTFLYGYPCIS